MKGICKQETNKHSKNEIEEANVSEQQAKTVSTNPNAKALSTFSKVAGFQRAEPFGRVSRRESPAVAENRRIPTLKAENLTIPSVFSIKNPPWNTRLGDGRLLLVNVS